MKIRRHKHDDPIEGWPDRIVVIWEEDDARPPDREMAGEAFERIFGWNPRSRTPLAKHDPKDDDWYAVLHHGGKVIGATCEGGFVGIVAEVEPHA